MQFELITSLKLCICSTIFRIFFNRVFFGFLVHLLIITTLSLHTSADSGRSKPTLKDAEQFRHGLRPKRAQSHEEFDIFLLSAMFYS